MPVGLKWCKQNQILTIPFDLNWIMEEIEQVDCWSDKNSSYVVLISELQDYQESIKSALVNKSGLRRQHIPIGHQWKIGLLCAYLMSYDTGFQ